MSHCFDLRILEHGDIKFRCLLRLIIEPQKWGDFLHTCVLRASSHLSTFNAQLLTFGRPALSKRSESNERLVRKFASSSGMTEATRRSSPRAIYLRASSFSL